MLDHLLHDIYVWFSMHGYGAYIWSAYGIAGCMLGLNLWYAKRYYHRTLQRIRYVP